MFKKKQLTLKRRIVSRGSSQAYFAKQRLNASPKKEIPGNR